MLEDDDSMKGSLKQTDAWSLSQDPEWQSLDQL